jgi:hypothetical protein
MTLRRGELPEHVRRDLQAAAALPNKFHRLGEINKVIALAKETYPTLFRENSMKIRLQNVRLAFPALFQPQTVASGEGDPAYSATFILPPDHAQIREIKAAIKELAKQKWAAKADQTLGLLEKQDKTALHDGDLKSNYDGFAGQLYISARTKTRPTVVDRNRSPLTAADGRPYGGCYVNAVVELWAQDNQYGKRINASLGGVQFAKDGESFGGGGNVVEADDFDDLSVNADDLL